MGSRKLTFNDFVSILSMRTGLKDDTIKRLYKKMVELIEEEIRIHGEVHLVDLGTLKVKVIPGRDKYVPLKTGGSVKRYCSPTLSMGFSPSVAFKKRLNKMLIEGESDYTIENYEEIEKNKGYNKIRNKLDELFGVEDKYNSEYESEKDIEKYDEEYDDIDDDKIDFDMEDDHEYGY